MPARRPRARRALPNALLAAAALLAATGCLPRGTARAPVVWALELPGAEAFPPDEIVELLATQPVPHTAVPLLGPVKDWWSTTDWTALFSTPLPDRRRIPIVGPPVTAFRRYQARSIHGLDQDALAVDRRRVEAFYRERGYFEARVEDVRVEPAGTGRVRVTMPVREGGPARVTRIDVVGLEDAPAVAERVRKLPIAVGDVFTVAAYDAAKAAISTALKETGYALGSVEQRAQILPEEGAAELTYTVNPGDRYRFGSVFVAGTAAVPRSLIRDQVGIELKPGQLYSESRLAKAQARVFDLNVFGGVRVTTGTPDEKRKTLPVVVAVREAPFRTVRFGPSVGLESQRFDTNLTLGWTHRNWHGDLRRLSIDARAGYAWLLADTGAGGLNFLDAAVKHDPVGLVTADFQQPRAVTRRIDLASRLTLERGLEPAYDFWSERAQVSLPFRISPGLTFIPSYNLEVYQVSVDTAGDRVGELEEVASCEGSGRGRVCLLSYFQQQIVWDRRNDPVNTTSGTFVSFSVQEGFDVAGTGYSYLRFAPELRGYLPLGERWTLAARAEAGGIVPISEDEPPPIVARFFAGGASSMRGFYARRLSPVRPDVTVGADEQAKVTGYTPVGGNGLFEGSLELRYALTETIGTVLFTDFGNVSLPDLDARTYLTAFDPTRLEWAVGAGLRYRTPVGPIRLDAAIRVPERWGAGVSFDDRFSAVPNVPEGPDGCPDAGGPCYPLHREPGYAIHITVGEAF